VSEKIETLGDALPKVMAHVRDVIVPEYIRIGPAGAFGLAMIRADLDAATRALATGDLPAMIVAYEALKAIE